MNRAKFAATFRCLLTATALLVTACGPTRKPIPPGEVPAPQAPTISDEQYGHGVLNALSERYTLDYNDPRYATVSEVVDRLTQAAGAAQDPWHVYLFSDPTFKNAAATRGNHVFIWSGMLDEIKSDDELAAILAHEIAHVLAKHTDPDSSEDLKKLLIQLGAIAASIAVSYSIKNPSLGQNLGDLTGSVTQELGKGLLVNPFSKDMELEADQVGLFLMADAHYDPRAAISFWERVKENPEFSGGIAFFSTHPPAEERLTHLNELLPQAEERYQRAAQSPTAASAASQAAFTTSGTPTKIDLPGTVNPNDHGQLWRVVADKAVVYSRRSIESRALGEFPSAAEVRVLREDGNWLEIDSPDGGYVRKKVMEKVDP